MSKIAPAKIVSQKSHAVAGMSLTVLPKLVPANADSGQGKLKVTEHFFDVPKDYSKPDGGTIRIFARSVKKNETPIVPDTSKDKDQPPWLVFKMRT